MGLRALATGLPPAFFLRPRQAMAEAAAGLPPQYLILSTSGSGDPLNCNAPGTYDLPNSSSAQDFMHPAADSMRPVPVTLGGRQVRAAAPWASLSAATLARTSFSHHATMTANHGDQPNVIRLMGAMRRGQMATSLVSASLASLLGTVQQQPICLAGEVTQFNGQYQPRYTPLGISSLLLGIPSPLDKLEKLRDEELMRITAAMRTARASASQRRFVDGLAQSQGQLRQLVSSFGSDLGKIKNNGADAQALVAAVLIKMKVTPLVTIHISFGDDNHADPDLANESQATVGGVASINNLLQNLKTYELSDAVTFATLNVFGRTFHQAVPGRGHNGGHHVMVAIGKHIASGVVGGLGPDGRAMGIDPSSGAALSTGGIGLADSLSAVGRTLGEGVGVPPAVLQEQIPTGQRIADAGGLKGQPGAERLLRCRWLIWPGYGRFGVDRFAAVGCHLVAHGARRIAGRGRGCASTAWFAADDGSRRQRRPPHTALTPAAAAPSLAAAQQVATAALWAARATFGA